MDDERILHGNILIVRHLPSSLDASEKEDLLKHFGAVGVKCMANHGRMKHTAFATFLDNNAATQALRRLHQLNVLGHALTVEFAKTRRQAAIATPSISDRYQPDTISNGENKKKKRAEEKDGEYASLSVEDMQRKSKMKSIGLAPDLGLSHPIDSRLKYHYPPPTVSILSNIVNALASVPKFYVQTLHLMNKMNLPAPFGPLTPAPPLEDDQIVVPPEPVDDATPAEMEVSSSSEGSEIESDEESREQAKKLQLQLGHGPVKRPSKKKPAAQRKRPRLQDMIATSAPTKSSVPPPDALTSGVGGGVTRKEVFDPTQAPKRPEIRLAESITSAMERQIQQGQIQMAEDMPAPTNIPVTEEIGGFGTFQPPLKPSDAVEEEEEEEEEEEDEGPESAEFITREQLKKRLSKEEMKHISVFKNYTSGEPTTRLYIKNLGKQIEEKDLKFIFGRYVDWSSPLDKDMFNIQLMKQGRMKGQAFVGLPSELAAQRALRDTNGLLVNDKPIVVSFARSAKPKEKEDPKQKKKEAAKKAREARRI